MSISTKRLAACYIAQYEIEHLPCKEGVVNVLRNLLLESLSPDEYRVYAEVRCIHDGAVSAVEIAQAFKMTLKWVSMILNRLWRYRLLDRASVIDDKGKYYVYEVAK